MTHTQKLLKFAEYWTGSQEDFHLPPSSNLHKPHPLCITEFWNLLTKAKWYTSVFNSFKSTDTTMTAAWSSVNDRTRDNIITHIPCAWNTIKNSWLVQWHLHLYTSSIETHTFHTTQNATTICITVKTLYSIDDTKNTKITAVTNRTKNCNKRVNCSMKQ